MSQKKFRNKYQVVSNRSQCWDYSFPGSYFITFPTHKRARILGKVINKKVVLSEFGEIVKLELGKVDNYSDRVFLDEWIIMPDHIHFILLIYGETTDSNGGKEKILEFSQNVPSLRLSDYKRKPSMDELIKYRRKRRGMLIPKIISQFKNQTSKKINVLRGTPGNKNWQKDYIAKIITDEVYYQNIKNYIINNPAKWTTKD